jgi:histidinol dehydrogenase
MLKRNPRISVESLQRLPAGNACIALVVKEVSSVTSTASVTKCLALLPALGPEHLKLSLDEWIELTIMVHGLWSFHRFEKLGHRSQQHLTQQ